MDSRQSLIVAVDGGGSGSRLAVFDDGGNIVASTFSGPAQLSLDVGEAWQNIRLGIAELASSLDLAPEWQPQRLVMGLAGSLQESRRHDFLNLIPAEVTPQLVTDGHAQLLGAGNGQAGACLSVGTGSVLHWQGLHGEFGMAGGWGFPSGDEGAGAWLGRQMLIAFTKTLDLGSTANGGVMFELMTESIGTGTAEVQRWTTCKNPTQLASLVPLLLQAVDLGDTGAIELLEHGCSHCEHLLSYAPESLPVYVVGGLSERYLPMLEQKDHLQGRFHQPHADALTGLYLLSQSAASSA